MGFFLAFQTCAASHIVTYMYAVVSLSTVSLSCNSVLCLSTATVAPGMLPPQQPGMTTFTSLAQPAVQHLQGQSTVTLVMQLFLCLHEATSLRFAHFWHSPSILNNACRRLRP